MSSVSSPTQIISPVMASFSDTRLPVDVHESSSPITAADDARPAPVEAASGEARPRKRGWGKPSTSSYSGDIGGTALVSTPIDPGASLDSIRATQKTVEQLNDESKMMDDESLMFAAALAASAAEYTGGVFVDEFGFEVPLTDIATTSKDKTHATGDEQTKFKKDADDSLLQSVLLAQMFESQAQALNETCFAEHTEEQTTDGKSGAKKRRRRRKRGKKAGKEEESTDNNNTDAGLSTQTQSANQSEAESISKHDPKIWNEVHIARLNEYDFMGDLDASEVHFGHGAFNSFRNSLDKKGIVNFQRRTK